MALERDNDLLRTDQAKQSLNVSRDDYAQFVVDKRLDTSTGSTGYEMSF